MNRVMVALVSLWVAISACEPTLPAVGGGAVMTGLTGLEWRPADLTVAKGQEAAPRVFALLGDGTSREVTAEGSYWSEAEAVASVSNVPGQRGVITGLGEGRGAVRAEYEGFSATLQVEVLRSAPVQLRLSPSSASASVGMVVHFDALAEYADGSRRVVPASELTWSTQQPGLAAVVPSSPGNWTALAVGEAQLEAQWQGLSARGALQVQPATVTRVQVSPQVPVLDRGESLGFTAVAWLSDGTSREVTAEAVWSSSVPEVALVSNRPDAKGITSARLPGNSVIGASWQGTFGSALLTVAGAAPTTLELLPLTPLVSVGATRQLYAIAGFADGSTEDFTDLVVWQSANPALADVSHDSAGLFQAKAGGQVKVEANFRGLVASTTISVIAAPLVSLELTGPATLAVGQQAGFTAQARFADGLLVEVTSHATWLVTTPRLAQVTNTAASRGLVTATAQGAALLDVSFAGRRVWRPLAVVP